MTTGPPLGERRASVSSPADGTGGMDTGWGNQAENELPQPQPPVAFGFLKVKPDPCIEDT